MFHPKAEYGCAVIVSNLLLLGVKAYPLADNGRLGAGGAPDWKGHFEAHGEDALARLAGAVSKSISGQD